MLKALELQVSACHCLFSSQMAKICSAQISSNAKFNVNTLRYYSNSGDGNSDDDLNPSETRALPRRVLKRLEAQGITPAEYFKSLNKKFGSQTQLKKNSSHTQFEYVEQRNENIMLNVKPDDLDVLLKAAKVVPNELNEDEMFPSDMIKFKKWEKDDSDSKRPRVEPENTTIVLFPGQGSQFVGMGKKLLGLPGVKDLYEEASSLLGYNLLDMCLNGPKSELDKTIYCQPAVMITSLAAVERLREEHPQAIENCVATAGFSVGEFSALVFSGVISFPDAIRIVKLRAEAMQRESEKVSSGMMSVFLAHDSDLKGAMKLAKEYCETRHGIKDPVCKVANYLFPECKVLAGHTEALEFINTNRRAFNLLRTKPLAVSGAFHTSLMYSASKTVQQAFQNVKLDKPKIQTYSNVSGVAYRHNMNFPHVLSKQVVEPVMWEQTLHDIYKRPVGVGFPSTFEVGPGKQMGMLLKQVNRQAFKKYDAIEV